MGWPLGHHPWPSQDQAPSAPSATAQGPWSLRPVLSLGWEVRHWQGEDEDGTHDSLKPGGHSVLPCGLLEGEPPPRPTPWLQAEELWAWRQDGCGLHRLLLCSGWVCLSPRCLGPALFPPWPLSTRVLGQWPPPWGESPSYHSYFRRRMLPWRWEEGGHRGVRQMPFGQQRWMRGGCDLSHLGFGLAWQ